MFLLYPSIQEVGSLENTLHVFFNQQEAETGGQQLLYHGRSRSAVGSAHELLDKPFCSGGKEDMHGKPGHATRSRPAPHPLRILERKIIIRRIMALYNQVCRAAPKET